MKALRYLNLAVRLMLVVMFFLPNLASAQQIHTFRNGVAADADKFIGNFSTSKEQVLLQTHPLIYSVIFWVVL